MDLREWDFIRDGDVLAYGYWDFYFGAFLTNRQFDSLSEKYYSWVPSSWNRGYIKGNRYQSAKERRSSWPHMPYQLMTWHGEKIGGTGFASYSLTLLLPPGQKDLAFKVTQIGTAYKLFIDDSLTAFCGTVGTTTATSCPEISVNLFSIKNLEDTARITLWISNFHYKKGGPWDAVIIGDPEIMARSNFNQTSLLVFSTGIWLMACFVLAVFFIYRPKEKSILWLFLWSLSLLVRTMTVDERLITLYYPDFNFEWLMKLSTISSHAMVPIACMVLRYLFPLEFSKTFVRIYLALFVLVLVITLVTKAIFYTHFNVPYTATNFLVLIYASFLMIKAMIHRREGAIVIGVGVMLASSLYLFQGLYYFHITHRGLGSLSNSSGFVFAFGQVLLIAKIFSSSLTRIEGFAGEMETTIEERTHDLMRMQEQLIVAARQAETEKIRMRISQDIHDDISSGLNKITWLGEMVKIKALKNKPEEVVASLDKILKIARESVDHLIEIIWSLNPHSDDLEGLFSYMRNYINRFFDDTPFNVTVNFPAEAAKVDINPEMKRNLFLVMKEALNNAAKYSRAQHITIECRIEGLAYTFSVTDDGIGFEKGEVRGTGNGMKNMLKRMEDINGRLKVESAQGKGTSIFFEGSIY